MEKDQKQQALSILTLVSVITTSVIAIKWTSKKKNRQWLFQKIEDFFADMEFELEEVKPTVKRKVSALKNTMKTKKNEIE